MSAIPQIPFDYAKAGYYWRAHHERYRRHVESRQPQLVCQECGGAGGEVVPILDDSNGPFEPCGFCEGTGLLTSSARGWWLRWKRSERAMAEARKALVKA